MKKYKLLFTLLMLMVGVGFAYGQSQYPVDIASSTPTTSSPGIVFSWPDYSSQNMLYGGRYLNLYGFGFHGFDDGTSIPGGGVNGYFAGYFGLDFFTGAQRRFRINTNGNAIVDQKMGVGGMPAMRLDVGDYTNGSMGNKVVFRVRNTIAANQESGWGSALEFYNLCNNTVHQPSFNEGGAKIISEASQYGWSQNLKFRVVANNGYVSQTAYDAMVITPVGNIGIGTSTPGSFKLAVAGKIWGQEVQVALTNPGPDYVFDEDYALPSLDSVQSYISHNKHLPEVPSAKEMKANGINVGEMNMLLLKKVEELTLYSIEMNRMLQKLSKENEEQARLNMMQQKVIEELKNKIK